MKALRALGSLKVTVALLLAAAIVVFAGSLELRVRGSAAAHAGIFGSWATLIGPIPFPGIKLVAALALVHLPFAMLRRGRRPAHAGLLVAHAGIFALCLIGLAPGPERTFAALHEGGSVSSSFDPTSWDLVLEPGGPKVPWHSLREGVPLRGAPSIVVERLLANAHPLVGPGGDELSGLAPQRRQPDPAANRPGVALRIATTAGVRRTFVWAGRPAPLAGAPAGGGPTSVRLARSEQQLPVELSLTRLAVETYPQTSTLRRLDAALEISGNGPPRQVELTMSRAFSAGGLRFTASSVATDESGAAVLVLAVKRERLRVPFIAAVSAIVVGLALEAGLRVTGLAALLFLGLQPLAPLSARDRVPYEALGGLPVLSRGRLMPLETFASLSLNELCGGRRLQGEAALSWMARVLFAPESTLADPLFRVRNRETLVRLGLRFTPGPLSYAQLEPAAGRLQDLADKLAGRRELSAADREILELKGKVLLFTRLAASSDHLRPHRDFTVPAGPLAARLGLSPGPHSLRQIAAVRDLLGGPWEDAAARQGAGRLLGSLARWQKDYATVVPSIVPLPGGEWTSAASATAAGGDGAAAAGAFSEAAEAFSAGDAAAFRAAVAVLEERGARIAARPSVLRAVRLETLYGRVRPFAISMVLYALGLALLALRASRPAAPVAALAGGLAASAAGFWLQASIVGGPPLAAQGVSFVAVGWLLAAGSLAVFALRRPRFVLAIGLASALLLTAIGRVLATRGDELAVAPAAFGANAWLLVHVAAACLGYAAALGASAIAHIWLLRRCFRREDVATLGRLWALLRATLSVALALVVAGTVVGALGAETAWGRFWDWDAKESGALLLILWLAALVHLPGARGVPQEVEAGAAASTVVVVAWSWLAAGASAGSLHAYGPTAAAAAAVAAGLEAGYLSAVALAMRRPGRPSRPDVWARR